MDLAAPPLSWFIGILVVAAAASHALIERRDKLADYLGRLLGFIAPGWMGGAFFVLALGGILIPLAGRFADPRHAAFWLSWMGAALLTDIIGTHLVPTIASGRKSPATETWPAYLALGVVALVTVIPPSPAGALLGFVWFAGLWPLLLGLKAAGMLRRAQGSET